MKRYGIRITLPADSTLRASHLLGPEWESYRWFATRDERERAFADMSRPLPNYRRGDRVSQVLERVEAHG